MFNLFFLLTTSRNLGLLSHMGSNQHFDPWINATDPSSVSLEEYRDWFSHHSSTLGPNITDCSLEEEMNKVSFTFNLNEFLI